jgi:hypothetical protein
MHRALCHRGRIGGFDRQALLQPLVRPRLVVVPDVLRQHDLQVLPTEDQQWSSSSRRAVPTHRSTKVFARGDR